MENPLVDIEFNSPEFYDHLGKMPAPDQVNILKEIDHEIRLLTVSIHRIRDEPDALIDQAKRLLEYTEVRKKSVTTILAKYIRTETLGM